jgi:hypothetical protein
MDTMTDIRHQCFANQEIAIVLKSGLEGQRHKKNGTNISAHILVKFYLHTDVSE